MSRHLGRTLADQPASPTTRPPRPNRSRRRAVREGHRTGRVLRFVALSIGAVVMAFPFYWTVTTSLTPNARLTALRAWPEKTSLEAYALLIETLPFIRIVGNSLWIATVSTLVQLLTSAMAAYVFARMHFRGRDVLFVAFLSTMMIPQAVLVVPLFIEMRMLGLVDTYLGLLAPSLTSVFAIFLLRQSIRQLPRELDDAAIIDGAGHIRIFFQIVLPLIRPVLATLAVLAFMGSWNNFLWPLIIIRSPELMTLPLGLATLRGQYTNPWEVVMAGSVISILPMALLYLVAQKYVVQGIASAGLK
jgi:multiple sugar transport system permease protein